jgi:hypothetical protein
VASTTAATRNHWPAAATVDDFIARRPGVEAAVSSSGRVSTGTPSRRAQRLKSPGLPQTHDDRDRPTGRRDSTTFGRTAATKTMVRKTRDGQEINGKKIKKKKNGHASVKKTNNNYTIIVRSSRENAKKKN